jgi:hypothetical protein
MGPFNAVDITTSNLVLVPSTSTADAILTASKSHLSRSFPSNLMATNLFDTNPFNTAATNPFAPVPSEPPRPSLKRLHNAIDDLQPVIADTGFSTGTDMLFLPPSPAQSGQMSMPDKCSFEWPVLSPFKTTSYENDIFDTFNGHEQGRR